jgi:2-polyprenyl-3-methyl-5-hydroxy-6-metoxy-1,4-benzoquinol methylase
MNLKKLIPVRIKIFLKFWFTNKVSDDDFLSRSFTLPTPKIDFTLTKKQNEELLSHTAQVWKKLGNEEPHWSVLTHPKYTSHNLRKNLKDFNKTGYTSAKHLLGSLNQIGISKRTLSNLTVMEIGSSVGRVTIPLANVFKRVIATDISKQHLRILEICIKEKKFNNITIKEISKIEDFDSIKVYSGLYSVITLQHNPPPIQKAILSVALKNLKPGGFFFFQTPTYIPNYEFEFKRYIKMAGSQMEMHPIPMPEILDLLVNVGCTLKMVLRDNWTGRDYDSHTFIGVKNLD